MRDALSRLRDEGLVEMAAQRFTRVATMSVHDIHEIVPLLASVHAHASEFAVPRLGTGEIDELRDHNQAFFVALRKRDADAAFRADERFHDVFVATCGIDEVARVLARLTPRLQRIERLLEADLPGSRSVAQHQALITAAQKKDAAGASSAARANWTTLGAVLERGFAPAGPPPTA